MLRDKLEKLQSLNVPKGCPVAAFAGSNPEDGAAIMEALDGPVSVVQISRLLTDEGITIGRERLYAHRNKECTCFRDSAK
jgi:hypothetical protein